MKRNKLRRRIKEAFRLNKSLLNAPLEAVGKTIDMAVIYLDKEVQPYTFLEKRMKEMLQKLAGKIVPATTDEEKQP